MHNEEIKTIIWLYTLDRSPCNIITNNLLRSSRNPSEIFDCQPYFRDLFKVIKTLHLTQAPLIPNQGLILYRGATASEKEINFYKNNVGKIVMNLGFFSTSRNEKRANKFAENLFFIIKMSHEKREKHIGHGYADISQYSQFPDE